MTKKNLYISSRPIFLNITYKAQLFFPPGKLQPVSTLDLFEMLKKAEMWALGMQKQSNFNFLQNIS